MRPARVVALSLACACWGCATAPVRRLHDPEFVAAQRRLRESADALVAPRVLEPDEVLFLQAESFYRYRFRLKRGPSAGAYFAQAAAAFTDFAPLTVLAATRGALDLRLRAYDGATDLYGTLCAVYPHSPLRPLALYRLGWACRDTSSEGEPCAPNRAFGTLLREYPASPPAALAREALRVPWKSLDRATLWSILPGAGQIYAGETLNGVARLSIAAGLGALALVPIVGMIRARRFGWVPTALSLAGVVGLQVVYTTSYQDAERAVLDFNEGREDAFDADHVSPRVESGTSRGPAREEPRREVRPE